MLHHKKKDDSSPREGKLLNLGIAHLEVKSIKQRTLSCENSKRES